MVDFRANTLENTIIPEKFICPISHEIMVHPVYSQNDQHCEKACFEFKLSIMNENMPPLCKINQELAKEIER